MAPRNRPHGSINSHLPVELIIEIFSRLAVVSLLRCKSVCSSWRALVSGPDFVKKFSRIVFISRATLALRTCSVQSLLQEPCVDTSDIANSELGHRNWARIVGSCNGLICISSFTYTLSFWNPCTKRSRRLIFTGPEGGRASTVYGFGYDESRDDYKAVMIYSRNTKGCVDIYSLRSNSWKKILDWPYQIRLGSNGKYVNGGLHWGFIKENGGPWVIVALDLGPESFREVPQPNYGEGGFVLELGVLRGCLCVVCDLPGDRADIWVMNEYGVRESWTKVVSIPYMTGHTGWGRYSNPLWVSDDGEILLEFRNRLVVYNSEKNTLKNIDIQNYDAALQVHSYVASLVSPVHKHD